MTPRRGLAIGLVLGLAALLWSLAGRVIDYDLQWLALRALLAGENPYRVVGPGLPYDFPFPMYYPLPATLLVSPLGLLPLAWARLAFILLSSGVLAWAVTRDGSRLLPMFFSASFVHATLLGQWTPLLTASFLVPALGFVAIAKPQTGLAVLIGTGSRRYLISALVGGLALCAVSFAVLPTWPLDWLATVRSAPPGSHSAPILLFGGPLLLAALWRWREPEARLLLALSCFPQTGTMYDTLPLFLVARTQRQAWVLCGMSIAAFLVQVSLDQPGGLDTTTDPIARFNLLRLQTAQSLLWLMYLPALAIVLWNGWRDHLAVNSEARNGVAGVVDTDEDVAARDRR